MTDEVIVPEKYTVTIEFTGIRGVEDLSENLNKLLSALEQPTLAKRIFSLKRPINLFTKVVKVYGKIVAHAEK